MARGRCGDGAAAALPGRRGLDPPDRPARVGRPRGRRAPGPPGVRARRAAPAPEPAPVHRPAARARGDGPVHRVRGDGPPGLDGRGGGRRARPRGRGAVRRPERRTARRVRPRARVRRGRGLDLGTVAVQPSAGPVDARAGRPSCRRTSGGSRHGRGRALPGLARAVAAVRPGQARRGPTRDQPGPGGVRADQPHRLGRGRGGRPGHDSGEPPDRPTVRLRTDTETFLVLVGGRRAAEGAAVEVEGDLELARRVLDALAVTP